MSVKLYLDADITGTPLLATTLRQRGYDVVSAVAVGNNALSDEAQFTYAIEQGHVLLTFNIKDFIPLAEKLYAEGKEFPGLIVSPQIKGPQFAYLVRLVLNLLHRVDEASLRNTIRFLQEYSWLSMKNIPYLRREAEKKIEEEEEAYRIPTAEL